jgi:hypothetical protein
METHGSIGVVLWAAANRLVPMAEAEVCWSGLEKSSLWMSPEVRAEAKAALKKLK